MPQIRAEAEECPTYDFQSLFFDDYTPGRMWDNRGGIINISWSADASVIYDESVTRSFTIDELEWIRSAFQSWDNVLETVKFSEITQSAQAKILIGYVALNQPRSLAYWNASRRGGCN